MRQLGYVIGLGFLLVAGATLVAQIFSLWASGGYRPISIGSMVWAPIQFVLTIPAWLSLAVPGALLALLCRPRQRGLGGL